MSRKRTVVSALPEIRVCPSGATRLMNGDYHSIQEIGGEELVRHYPDQGLIPDASWYNAVLHVESTSGGLRGWLRALSVETQAFGAVLSANGEGLRVFVPLDRFAIFLPWAEAAVSAERGWPATVVRIEAAAVPSLALLCHLDDTAADDLLRGVVPPLPLRHPPRRLAWWISASWVVWAVVGVGVGVGLILALALGKR